MNLAYKGIANRYHCPGLSGSLKVFDRDMQHGELAMQHGEKSLKAELLWISTMSALPNFPGDRTECLNMQIQRVHGQASIEQFNDERHPSPNCGNKQQWNGQFKRCDDSMSPTSEESESKRRRSRPPGQGRISL